MDTDEIEILDLINESTDPDLARSIALKLALDFLVQLGVPPYTSPSSQAALT